MSLPSLKLILVASLTTSLMVAPVTSQLIPAPVCFAIELAFQILGCAAGTSEAIQCELLSVVLRLALGDEGICQKEPCVGYGVEDGRACTGLFPRTCDSDDRYELGICPLGRECCSSLPPSIRDKQVPKNLFYKAPSGYVNGKA